MKKTKINLYDLVYVTDKGPGRSPLNGLAIVRRININKQTQELDSIYLIRLDGYNHGNLFFLNGYGFNMVAHHIRKRYTIKLLDIKPKVNNLYYDIFYDIDIDSLKINEPYSYLTTVSSITI
jgi:hypothetical protein